MTIKRKLAIIILGFIAVLALSLFFVGCGGGSSSGGGGGNTDVTVNNGTGYTLIIYFDNDQSEMTKVYSESGNTLSYSNYTNRTGYEFLGYYTSDGTMMFDANGAQCSYLIDEDMVLYAKFAAKSYTIKYMYADDDGNYTVYNTETVTYGSELVSLLSAPSKTGYDFVGWARSSSGTSFYSDGTTPKDSTFNGGNYAITSDGEVIMFAIYKIQTFTVTLVYYNSDYENKTVTVNYGDTLPDLSDYYVDTGSKEVIAWSSFATENVAYTAQIYMDITLYSIWKEYKYINLVYASDDIRQYKVYNESTTSCVLPADATLPGYSLDGWYTTSTFSGNPVASAPYALLAEYYYAKWNIATYTITFVYDGESYDDIKYTVESAAITLPQISKEGYNFYGWCTDSSLSGTAITQIVPSTSEGGYGDFTLYPKLEKYSSTINYYFDNTKLNSITIEYGDTLYIEVPTSKLGNDKVFNYWYILDGNSEIIITDANGNGLAAWTYTGDTYRVFASYEQLYLVTFSYSDPVTGSTYSTSYGYKHVGDTVTFDANTYANYGIEGYYINNELVCSSDTYEYVVTNQDVTITAVYTFKVAKDFSAAYNFSYTVYYYNGHYYSVVNEMKYWTDAKTWCEFYGGHLVTLTTEEETNWVSSLVAYVNPGVYTYYLGGYLSNGTWYWVNNEGAFDYTNWGSGEPSGGEQYLSYWYGHADYGWNDWGSSNKGYFIIEWDSYNSYVTTVTKTTTDYNGDSVTLTLYKYNNHYYAVVNTTMLWNTAETYAEYIGGYLATATTSGENTFIGSLINNAGTSTNVYWLGGSDYDTEGTWIWVTGETFSYSNWISGEPNDGNSSSKTQDYMTIAYSSYGWDDDYNTSTFPFVIEWDSLDNFGVFTPLYAIKTITTASEFMSIQDNTAGYYILDDDITLTGSWTPVDFSGTLIGNGHTVSGITVNQSSGNAGVFLNVTGYIENVTFEVTVNSTSTSTVYVGGAVAYLNGGTLNNITVKGTVTSASATAYTGGVVGYYSTGTVSGLTNYATVNGSATGTGTTGGVIGRADIFGVTDLENYGDVTGYYDVGGVIGYMHAFYSSGTTATLTGFENYGNVSGDSSSGSTGGVIGVLYRSLSNTTNYSVTLDGAKNYGDVTSTSGNVGGVVGYVYLANTGNGAFVFIGEDLYNEGDVTSSKGNVGGLVGYGYAKSTTSYIYGTSSANVSGTYYVGGIAGYLNNISLKGSSNAGSTVSASGYTNDGTGDCVGVGGYVGYGYNITISDCDNAVAITYTGGTYKYVGGVVGCLRGSITNCTNAAAVTSSGYEVGGIVGTLAVPSSETVSNLTNSGAVEGTSYKVGGVFGNIWWDGSVSSNIVLTLSDITNSGNVISSSYGAGGIVGYIYFNNSNGSYTISIQATGLENTGDVTGTYQVGGIVGYGYTESNSSYITSSSSEANVTGTYYVGGLAGYLSNIALTNSDNTGSTVTATSYFTSSGTNYVYVGGYVGYGYKVSGCDNAVDIAYHYSAWGVAGVAGELTGTISDCSNSGDITAETSYCVGGVCGRVVGVYTGTISGLSNTGVIKGYQHVGGVLGAIYTSASYSANYTIEVSDLVNESSVTGANYDVGGVIGHINVTNTNGSYTLAIYITDLKNSGSTVSGTYNVGGLVGYGNAESNSSYLTSSSSSAAVTGTYYVGGLAGYLGNISLTSSSNLGSAVTATSYASDSGVYLGGYVGYGYKVSGLENAVNITYSYSAKYIGGVAGYLTGTVSDCSNSGTIKAASTSQVGGVAGMVVYGVSGTTTMSNLSNTGAITGSSYVGGVLGELYYSSSISGAITMTLSTFTNSGAITASGTYAGGIIGYVKLNNSNGSYTYVLDSTGLVNTGNVTNTSYYAGGIFGYGYAESNLSYITESSSSGAITGTYYVGGIAGYLENISITDCSNAGSTVTATNYNSDSYVYLGGYVGCGYSVSGCVNAVNITYNYAALYIGGIAGYLTGTVTDCTNSGNINAANASRMGGIVGRLTYAASGAISMANLTNTGDITGAEYVGGIFGRLYYKASVSYSSTISLTNVTNSGAITISGSYVGGIAGHVYLNNTNGSYTYSLYASGITNTGAITGSDYVYGIFGGGEIETASTVSDYTSTGTITCDGTYYGETYTGSNITFS